MQWCISGVSRGCLGCSSNHLSSDNVCGWYSRQHSLASVPFLLLKSCVQPEKVATPYGQLALFDHLERLQLRCMFLSERQTSNFLVMSGHGLIFAHTLRSRIWYYCQHPLLQILATSTCCRIFNPRCMGKRVITVDCLSVCLSVWALATSIQVCTLNWRDLAVSLSAMQFISLM